MPGGIRFSLLLLGITLLAVVAMTAYCFSQPTQPEPPNVQESMASASSRMSS